MHVRETTVRRGTKTWRYIQIVRSYRRADGMPMHEVIASFPYESELQLTNLRNFVHAQREGATLLIAGEMLEVELPPQPVAANLRYLDLAVLRQVWQDAGMRDVLTAVLPSGDEDCPPADVVEALILHRCVAPGSKFSAVRWYQRTALPRMIGISPDQFNNSRLHRTLELVEQTDDALQERLPLHISKEEGQFAALFLDGTDTWFEGTGPELASVGRTKDGAFRRKIGIILLCDHRGFPLRWKVLDGRQSEITGMTDIWEQVAACPWVGDAPIVADRAMGSAAIVAKISSAGPRFLVAVREPEFRTWAPTLAGLAADLKNSAVIVNNLKKQGFVAIDRRTWAKEFLPLETPVSTPEVEGKRSLADDLDLGRQMLAHGGSLRAKAAAFRVGVTNVRRYLSLTRLSDELTARVKSGEAAALTLRALVAIAELEGADVQMSAFAEALAEAGARKPRTRRGPAAALPEGQPPHARRVVYFNMEMFSDQRRHAQDAVAELEGWVAELNGRVHATPKRYTEEKLLVQVGRELARRSLVDAFDVTVAMANGVNQVQVVIDQKEWARRRSFDGHSLLLAHPGMTMPPAQLIVLYRQRNIVEVDFRTIKSVIDLRPVFHRTDPKVRAHVTICVLALMLCRLLERRLASAKVHLSASAAVEVLATCHLNQLIVDRRGAVKHTCTRRTDEQEKVLKALKMQHLVEDTTLKPTHP